MNYIDKKNRIIIGLIFIFALLVTSLSGCLEFLNIDYGLTVYESHPTNVRYTISYGYRVGCSGTGQYVIHYDCNLPATLQGSISTELLYHEDFEKNFLVNNPIVRWNISGKNSNNYEIGIIADVVSMSYYVSDLNGGNALTLQEIKTLYPDLVERYCHKQTDNNITYIDPNDPQIKSIAENVFDETKSNNSFIVAKEIFIWLKQNTVYQMHDTNNNPQPAIKTFQLGSGDCDDLSFLYISLCRSVDIPARFINGCLIDEVNGKIGATGHAWVEIFVGENIGEGGWIPVECSGGGNIKTEVNQNFGLEDVDHLRLFKDDGSNKSLNASLSGLSVKHDEGIIVDMTSFVEIDNYIVLESKELVIDKNGKRSYEII